MTLGARFYACVIPAGREGKIEMPFGTGNLKNFWAYRDPKGAGLAPLPSAERVDRFEEAVWHLQKEFRSIRQEDLEKNAWRWMCPCPIHSYPGQRLHELILHERDIRNEPDSDLLPHSLGAAVDVLDFRLPFFFNHTPDPELSGTFRFEITAPACLWALKTTGGRAGVVGGDRHPFGQAGAISL